MSGKGNSGHDGTPLSPRVVRAIEDIQSPPPAPDFWSRLEESVSAGEDGPSAAVLDGRPRFGTRTAVVAVAAAVLLAVTSMAALRLRQQSVEPDVTTGPADQTMDGQTPATGPDGGTDGNDQSDPPLTVTVTVDDNGDARPDDATESDQDQTTSLSSSGTDEDGRTTTVPTTSIDSTTDPSASDPSTTEPPGGTDPSATNVAAPTVIEAESMPIMTAGIETDDGWNLFSAGYIEDTVTIAEAGQYRITVRAKGFSTAETQPEMEVRVDGVTVDRTLVALGDYRDYVVVVSLSGGRQPLRVAFINDPNSPDVDIDLTIDRVTVTFLG